MLLRLCNGVAVIVIGLTLASCERHQVSAPPPNTVIVCVYRDRKSDFARQLDRKLYDFTNAHHTTRSGKWIFICTAEPYNYTEELGGKVAIVIKPQLVVLDRASDASFIRGFDVNVAEAVSACGADRMCPAFVPPWVSGDELEGAKEVLNAISR